MSVAVEKDTPAIMMKGMHGSNFGVWVAHGEGKFTFANERVLRALNDKKCVALRYTDDDGKPTER